MEDQQYIIDELINTYAEAYHNLGHSSLMGKIVALLLTTEEPLSLDEISERLKMSKGPISQISRKLKEHQLIERVWIPGERKDYYKAKDDIFGQAFRNYSKNMRKNEYIADSFITKLNAKGPNGLIHLELRMKEMKLFYSLMSKHHKAFLEEWMQVKNQAETETV